MTYESERPPHTPEQAGSELDYAEIRVIATAALANIVLQDFDAVSDEDVAQLAQAVLTLLSRLDALQAERDAARASADDLVNGVLAAEAQVEALTEALERIVGTTAYPDDYLEIAAAALSRVSRSEPAAPIQDYISWTCPECGATMRGSEQHVVACPQALKPGVANSSQGEAWAREHLDAAMQHLVPPDGGGLSVQGIRDAIAEVDLARAALAAPSPPTEETEDTMKTLNRFTGRRRYDHAEDGRLPDDMQIGDYWKVLDDDGQPKIVSVPGKLTEDCWRIVVPIGDSEEGFALGNLDHHTVRENDDGTISVLPGDGSSNSILVHGSRERSWHGYIYSGEFREIGAALSPEDM